MVSRETAEDPERAAQRELESAELTEDPAGPETFALTDRGPLGLPPSSPPGGPPWTPSLLTSAGARQRKILRLQQVRGNAYVQRLVRQGSFEPEERAELQDRPDGALLQRDDPQRTIGNREVSSAMLRAGRTTLQRQGEDEDEQEQPLSTAQVARARRFYDGKAEQYTADILRNIQGVVGTEQTGTVTDEMIQAVARWQEANPPLAVDGMAGPRTLPAAFPSGLAEEESVEGFAASARDFLEGGDWESLATPEERADALLERINVQLTAAGVPEVGRVIQDLGGSLGRFAFSLWSIRFDQATLEAESMTDEEAAELTDTIYHEARHAEQWFRMAQMLAGQGRTAEQIADEMGIPSRIADAAVADPLDPGSMEALIADGWYQSVYGSGRRERARVLGPSGTFEEYQNLPEEADAWNVGGQAGESHRNLPEEGVEPEE